MPPKFSKACITRRYWNKTYQHRATPLSRLQGPSANRRRHLSWIKVVEAEAHVFCRSQTSRLCNLGRAKLLKDNHWSKYLDESSTSATNDKSPLNRLVMCHLCQRWELWTEGNGLVGAKSLHWQSGCRSGTQTSSWHKLSLDLVRILFCYQFLRVDRGSLPIWILCVSWTARPTTVAGSC